MKHIFTFLYICIASITFSQTFSHSDYEKIETYIPMRDGVKLFTTIYKPKNSKEKLPFIVQRTPYSCAPYGKDTIPEKIFYNQNLIESGYIFVRQDMRGRWNSEGDFENTKPPYSFWDKKATDEITDTWDTFDWLIKNVKNNNGNIGMVGNSYLGWSSLVGAVSQHPNLKCVIAMAPVTNFYFEDFNRYGLFGLNYLPVLDVFGLQSEPTTEAWWNIHEKPFFIDHKKKLAADYYQFFLDRMALSNMEDLVDENNFFWKNIKAHPNYDEFHQKRDWIQHLDRIQCQTMIVGGWNDEQNLYGILNSFKKLDQTAPKSNAKIVLGPWTHGSPARLDTLFYLGDIYYGKDLSKHYQESIEYNYFEFNLKNKGEELNFKACVFDTGKKDWEIFQKNPFQEKKSITYYLSPNEKLSENAPKNNNDFDSYISNPFKPVPFVEDDHFFTMAPKNYMTDDQRFASKRPDVLTYSTEILKEDITVLGEIKAIVQFATALQDADLFVKIIDVFPMNRQPEETDYEWVKMNGYQHLVRVGYIRGRYRDDFSNPKPFTPNQKTKVEVPLLEVYHTFKKGHKIMIQIQSSMFPLFDLNPQNYVEDIYKAKKEDFKSTTHQVFHDSQFIFPIKK